MDATRFDNITRSLAGRFSRRSLLKRASAVAAGGIAAQVAVPSADAVDCAPGLVDCVGQCVDPDSDVYHCGMCGNFCGGVPRPGYSSIGQCVAGVCEAVCLPGTVECGDECVDVNADVYNCGACGVSCDGVPQPGYSSIGECVGGVCQAVCLPGTVECGDSCVDLDTDVYHCGACGNFCGGVPGPGYASVGECVSGICQPVCLPDADQCGSECTELSWDVNNCGACGVQCAAGEICCSGNCVGPTTADRFCDSCGLQGGWPQGCLEDEVCSGGICVAASTGEGSETQTDTDGLSDPSVAAYQLSVLESQSAFDELYDLMHPDAQIVVPRGVVTYWYTQYFAPLGPRPSSILGVETDDWTWEVIDRTYPGTAIVSFEQRFTNSDTVTDVVRLVQDVDGNWRWFFGRSEEFVQTMIEEATAAGVVDGDETLPEATGVEPIQLFGETVSNLDGIAPDCLTSDAVVAALPLQIQGAERPDQEPVTASGEITISYLPMDADPGNAYPDLMVTIRTLSGSDTPETAMVDVEASIDDWQGPAHSSPPRSLQIDIAADSPYLVSYYEEYTEVMGFVPVVTWGVRGGSELYGFAGPGIVAVNELSSVVAGAITTDAVCSA